MKSNKLSTYLIMLCLILAGGWGVLKIIDKPSININDQGIVKQNTALEDESSPKTITNQNASDDNFFTLEFEKVKQQLEQKQFGQAVQHVDQLYTRLNNQELDQFKALFMSVASSLLSDNENQAQQLLQLYTQSFDDADAWLQLSVVSAILKDWPQAVSALLRSSALEYRPDELTLKLDMLTTASSHLRASLESQGDEIAIRKLYQSLYDQHSNHPRFQLELAQAHLRIGDSTKARPLLETLQYDTELGEIAKQKLDKLNQQEAESKPTVESEAKTNKKRPDLVVPLIRSGNSFLVDVSVNAKPVRMLLDTGASITALSQNTIQRLRLKPTGRYIQLNTANGVRRSQLYQARKVTMGRLTIDSLTVAEIDMEQSSRIQGLLGTDLLNQLDSRYSYLIDNQQNALIFRRR